MKKVIIPVTVMLGMTAFGIKEYNNYQNKQLINRIRKSEYNPQTMIEVKLQEKRKQEEMDNKIQKQKEELVEYIGSDEYKLREETRSWRLPRGISIDQLQPIMMEISYYSDLAIENSKYGNITATGKTLQNGMIANNHLDFGTNVYIEGEGMKVVEDRGNSKYFSTVAACDVFVPRVPGENNTEYFNRVNAKGRHYKQAYIIKES
jgi:hypothetical protein